MGPLVMKQHRDKVLGYIDAGVQEGAELVVDGRGLKLQGQEGGIQYSSAGSGMPSSSQNSQRPTSFPFS